METEDVVTERAEAGAVAGAEMERGEAVGAEEVALPQNFNISFAFYGKRLAIGVVFSESPVI